jgi:hypothetical protein
LNIFIYNRQFLIGAVEPVMDQLIARRCTVHFTFNAKDA